MSLTVVAAVGLLVVVSAFFSASEIAVFSLEDHRLGASPPNRAGTRWPRSGRTHTGCSSPSSSATTSSTSPSRR